jgi:hypothetical protein
MSEQNQDRWVDVLAGRQPASDRDTRQAASIRRYFEKEIAEDAQPLNDPQRTKRLLNVLEAQGLLKPKESAAGTAQGAVAQVPAKPKGLAGLLAWLLPEGTAPLRLGLMVGGLAALLAVPMILTEPDDSGYRERSVPRVGPAPGQGGAGASVQELAVKDPMAEATRLQAALVAAGAEEVRLLREGEAVVLEIRVGPQAAAAAQLAVQPWGVQLAAGSTRLKLVPAPRP